MKPATHWRGKMIKASRVQKMLNEQNAWIDKLKSQVMRLELDVVGYRTRNKQLEAALIALKAMHHEGGIDDLQERDDRTYFMVCEALESLK
jgi:predicted  nucleic acid-binding Zn-ribbon protein